MDALFSWGSLSDGAQSSETIDYFLDEYDGGRLLQDAEEPTLEMKFAMWKKRIIIIAIVVSVTLHCTLILLRSEKVYNKLPEPWQGRVLRLYNQVFWNLFIRSGI